MNGMQMMLSAMGIPSQALDAAKQMGERGIFNQFLEFVENSTHFLEAVERVGAGINELGATLAEINARLAELERAISLIAHRTDGQSGTGSVASIPIVGGHSGAVFESGSTHPCPDAIMQAGGVSSDRAGE